MPKKKPYSARYERGAPKKAKPRVAEPKSHALIPLDTAAIRKKAAKACEQARKRYEEAASDWERFQTRDTPDFARALALRAGPLREELRVLLPRYEELSGLLDQIEDEMFMSGDDPAECLERIEEYAAKRAASADAGFDGSSDESPDAEADDTDDERAEDFDLDEDEDEDEGEDASAEDDFDAFLRHMLGMEQGKKQAPAGTEHADRLKELYRELVRLLHPDRGGHITDKRMRLWHEVQEAYRSGDLARLEFLHAQSGQVADLSSPTLPVSRLNSLAALFKRSLRGLTRDLTAAKRDLAWGFSKLPAKARDTPLGAAEAELRAHINDIKEKIRHLEAQLEKIRHPKPRPKRTKRGSRGVPCDGAVLSEDELLDLLSGGWF